MMKRIAANAGFRSPNIVPGYSRVKRPRPPLHPKRQDVTFWAKKRWAKAPLAWSIQLVYPWRPESGFPLACSSKLSAPPSSASTPTSSKSRWTSAPAAWATSTSSACPTSPSRKAASASRPALKNCGFDFPYPQSVTVNLAPADIRKEGSGFDLPMALGILGCQGTFFGKPLSGYAFLGELSLDGSVRPVRGALSAALCAREQGIRAPGRAGGQRRAKRPSWKASKSTPSNRCRRPWTW